MTSTANPRTAPVPVLQQVWRLRGVRGANVCAIRRTDDSALLVDCGMPGAAPAIVEGLRAIGVERVSHLLLTHRHPDHSGSAAALREALRADVVIGAGDVQDDRVRLDGAPGGCVEACVR